MMKKVHVFLANGFEMVEALAVVDILRRAGIEVTTISIGDKIVISSHKVPIVADTTFEEAGKNRIIDDADMIFLPGGMPGTRNLEADERLLSLIKKYYEDNKLLAAICAAPSIYGHLGLLKGCNATCFPGFEKDLYDANVTGGRVEVAGRIITGKGMGTAIELGLKITEILVSKEKADEIAHTIQFI